MTKTERLAALTACAPKRICSYGSNPWAIIHTPSGAEVSGPAETIDHPNLGPTLINGPRYFPRKRDARAALDKLRAHVEKSK